MIVAVVEGQGDAEAVPVLIRRISLASGVWTEVKPHRVKRHRVVKESEFEKVLEFAVMQPGCSGIIVVLDADDDCPAELGPALQARAVATVGHLPVAVVLANSEFESWILAGIEGCRGQRGIPSDADEVDDPDGLTSPKGALERLMLGRSYLETDDQAAFAERFNTDLANKRSRSYRKMDKEVRRLSGVVGIPAQ